MDKQEQKVENDNEASLSNESYCAMKRFRRRIHVKVDFMHELLRMTSIGTLIFLGSTALASAAENTRISGYGGPIYRHMNLDDGARQIFGPRGALLIDRSLSLGLEAASSLGKDEGDFRDDEDESEIEQEAHAFKPKISFFGPFVSYAFAPDRMIHPVASLAFYWGALTVNGSHADFINILQPEIGAAIKLGERVKIQLSGGPRFVRGVSFRNKEDSDYQGATWTVAIDIGSFR
jgi:hypothetical protein